MAAGILVFVSFDFRLSCTFGVLVTVKNDFVITVEYLLLPPLLIAIDRRKS